MTLSTISNRTRKILASKNLTLSNDSRDPASPMDSGVVAAVSQDDDALISRLVEIGLIFYDGVYLRYETTILICSGNNDFLMYGTLIDLLYISL